MEKRKVPTETKTDKRRPSKKSPKGEQARNPATTDASAIELDESDLDRISGGAIDTHIKLR